MCHYDLFLRLTDIFVIIFLLLEFYLNTYCIILKIHFITVSTILNQRAYSVTDTV